MKLGLAGEAACACVSTPSMDGLADGIKSQFFHSLEMPLMNAMYQLGLLPVLERRFHAADLLLLVGRPRILLAPWRLGGTAGLARWPSVRQWRIRLQCVSHQVALLVNRLELPQRTLHIRDPAAVALSEGTTRELLLFL